MDSLLPSLAYMFVNLLALASFIAYHLSTKKR